MFRLITVSNERAQLEWGVCFIILSFYIRLLRAWDVGVFDICEILGTFETLPIVGAVTRDWSRLILVTSRNSHDYNLAIVSFLMFLAIVTTGLHSVTSAPCHWATKAHNQNSLIHQRFCWGSNPGHPLDIRWDYSPLYYDIVTFKMFLREQYYIQLGRLLAHGRPPNPHPKPI